MSERTEEDIGRICWGCDSEIYRDSVGDIECNCCIQNDEGDNDGM